MSEDAAFSLVIVGMMACMLAVAGIPLLIYWGWIKVKGWFTRKE